MILWLIGEFAGILISYTSDLWPIHLWKARIKWIPPLNSSSCSGTNSGTQAATLRSGNWIFWHGLCCQEHWFLWSWLLLHCGYLFGIWLDKVSDRRFAILVFLEPQFWSCQIVMPSYALPRFPENLLCRLPCLHMSRICWNQENSPGTCPILPLLLLSCCLYCSSIPAIL